MYEIDGIVYAGEAEKPITIKQVRTTDDYELILWFSNGWRTWHCLNKLILTTIRLFGMILWMWLPNIYMNIPFYLQNLEPKKSLKFHEIDLYK